MSNYQIRNLKDFIKAYGSYKSDLEISHMLDIPISKVENERSKVEANHEVFSQHHHYMDRRSE